MAKNKLPLKSGKIREYFSFKSKVTATAVISILEDIPNSDFNTPHAGQLEVIRAYDSIIPPSAEAAADGLTFEYKYRTISVLCGRRWGKSVICSVLGLTELMIPNSRVLIIAPALKNCTIIFDKIHSMLRSLDIKPDVERSQAMELRLENGATLTVASVENATSKLGSNVSLLLVDEAKLVPKNLIVETILPMLFDYSPLSRAVYITSPAPGWMEEMYLRGQSSDPTWKSYWSINSPTSVNPTIPAAELEEWRKTMPADIYNTEVLGLFNSTSGRVFSEFDRELNVFDIEDYPYFGEWVQNNYVVHSIDPGFQHYFAAVYFVYVAEVDHIFVFEEYNVNNTVTEVHAENMKKIEAAWGIEPTVRFGDPASAQMLADFATTHDMYFMKAEKGTQETVNQTNAQFFQKSSVTGKPKLLINRQCFELCRQVSELAWKVGRDELTKEQSAAGAKPFQPDRSGAKTDFDLCDALRYGILNFLKNNIAASVSVFSFDTDTDSEEDEFTNSMNRAGLFKM